MKTKLLLLVLIPFLLGINLAKGQGFTPPAPGKAVVYFARVTNWGGAVSFEFFHQDKYIGVFKGKNYLRYECDPGEQLLWASTENKEFVTADLKEGGTYVVIVDVIVGVMKGRVGFNPVTEKDVEFDRAKELILSEPPVITPADKIAKMNVKLAGFITEKLAQYETDWKLTKNFKHITPDMAIPAEALK